MCDIQPPLITGQAAKGLAPNVAGRCPIHPAAFAAAVVARNSKLMGLHLNDGCAQRDDGLMVGSVLKVATLDLLREVLGAGGDGAIYGASLMGGARVNFARIDRVHQSAHSAQRIRTS